MILGELLDVLEAGEAVAIHDSTDSFVMFDTVDNIGNELDRYTVTSIWATVGDGERATTNVRVESN